MLFYLCYYFKKIINSQVLGNPNPTFIYQTIFRKTGERIDIMISDTKSYTKEISTKLPLLEYVLYPVIEQIEFDTCLEGDLYKYINYFCDHHGIPYKNRKNLYLCEIEMISLYMHDCLSNEESLPTSNCTKMFLA